MLFEVDSSLSDRCGDATGVVEVIGGNYTSRSLELYTLTLDANEIGPLGVIVDAVRGDGWLCATSNSITCTRSVLQQGLAPSIYLDTHRR